MASKASFKGQDICCGPRSIVAGTVLLTSYWCFYLFLTSSAPILKRASPVFYMDTLWPRAAVPCNKRHALRGHAGLTVTAVCRHLVKFTA